MSAKQRVVFNVVNRMPFYLASLGTALGVWKSQRTDSPCVQATLKLATEVIEGPRYHAEYPDYEEPVVWPVRSQPSVVLLATVLLWGSGLFGGLTGGLVVRRLAQRSSSYTRAKEAMIARRATSSDC